MKLIEILCIGNNIILHFSTPFNNININFNRAFPWMGIYLYSLDM